LLKKHSYIYEWRWHKKNRNSLSPSYDRVNKIGKFSGWPSVRFALPFTAYWQSMPGSDKSCLQTIELHRVVAYFDTEGRQGYGSTWHFNARLIDHGRRAITYYRCEGWVIASEYRQEIGQKLQATALLTLAGKSPAGQIFIVLLSWLMRGWLPTG